MNIYALEFANYVNGNGKRFVVWFQGCNLSCKECWNKHTWSFEKKIELSPKDIFQQIRTVENLDGLTFTGGEPFLQKEELLELVLKIKDETKLSIQVFSGFEIEELQDKISQEILKNIDVLVFGRFDKTKENNNQKTLYLNNTKDLWEFNNSDVEIDIDEEGSFLVTGYAEEKFMNSLKDMK